MTLELVWTTRFPSFLSRRCVWTQLNFDHANLTVAALSHTLLKVCLPLQLFPVFYAVIGVSGSQKGDNFWVMDHVLTSPPSVNTCGHRWADELEKWTGNRRFIFLLTLSCTSDSSRASRKMPRSPCLAHKAPVMQATRSWCYGWSKRNAKGDTINSCDTLRVNLHLPQLLQNLMTTLHIMLFLYVFANLSKNPIWLPVARLGSGPYAWQGRG